MARLSRSRRAVLGAAVLALPLGLLPLAAASAVTPPTPVFSYIDASDPNYAQVLASANADGSSPTALTPAGFQTISFDATQDGQTELIGLCGGTGADCSGVNDYGYLRTTQSLVLVHHDSGSGATRARIISSPWDVKPRLTADGSPMWMADGVVYKISGIDYADPNWATTSWSSYPVATSSLFDPASLDTATTTWSTSGFAISSDGSEVAVLQRDDHTPLRNSRILAAPFAAATLSGSTYFAKSWTAPATVTTVGEIPSFNLFQFLDVSTLAFDTYKTPYEYAIDIPTAGDPIRENQDYGQIATLSLDNGTPAPVAAPVLDNVYDLRPFGGTWYGWKDAADLVNHKVISQYGSTGSPATVAISGLTPRSNGDVTFGYVPTSAVPAPLTAVMVTNPTSGTSTFFPRTRSVAYGKRATYYSAFEYWQDPTQQATTPTYPFEVQRGTLYYSVNRTSWRSQTTPGTQVLIGRERWSGVTAALTRNTWFYWVYRGDMLTKAAPRSATYEVTVAPLFRRFGIAKSGSRRIVAGTLTRVAGKAVLYRKVTSTRWKAVATVKITSKGVFSFGKLALAKGSYKVISLADTWWAASTRTFRI